mmetsp:Transcript_23760/g.51390  ORF Transcript_23760/g.51390 Transcript_23760/m.51390 type:complete len:181 (-) Transcript_23760:238-780(-)|eukprot:CAMPEP_0172312396 /NCGR_PEP_ID=MMETSP1058-20130122/17374_1 /TAXON_ID=83371 /ORGANISM="Detonula confervacea, Strain CCMP 353" /LENGTH=180 /DNA_ID=CAMNT_0013025835 /DNA_START=142 /DNA_END=684 /DNA_ORIENTATION=+
MPPRIEVDSNEDDWHHPAPRPSFTPTSNDEPSPLFRDHDITMPSTSRLDRRQSDPDFSAIVLKEDPIKKLLVVAPVVSRITAIIGPESAYVRTSTPSISISPPKTTAGPTSTPKQAQQQTTTTKKPPTPSPKGKIETKPILLRATRFVSKKGWKVVKSLPNKLVSTVGSVKIPGHHRNVV